MDSVANSSSELPNNVVAAAVVTKEAGVTNNVADVVAKEAVVTIEVVDTNKVETLVGDQEQGKETDEAKKRKREEIGVAEEGAVEIDVGEASGVKNGGEMAKIKGKETYVSDDEDSEDTLNSSDFHTSDFISFSSKEEDTSNSEAEVKLLKANIGGEDKKDKPVRASAKRAALKPRGKDGFLPLIPSVTTTGNGPNGRKVNGLLFKYATKDVSILCNCHGETFTAAEFVEHAGGINILNPYKHITVKPFNTFFI